MQTRLHVSRRRGRWSIRVWSVSARSWSTSSWRGILRPSEFGTFALLLGGFLGLQLVHLVAAALPDVDHACQCCRATRASALQATTVLLVAALCVPLCAALLRALAALGRADLIPAALPLLLCWQLQESMRRGLLAEFRQARAMYGDAAPTSDRLWPLAGLIYFGHLTLTNALYAMAGCLCASAPSCRRRSCG